MSNIESALKLSAYTDSKLQFFYLKKAKGTMTAVKGLPRDASELMQNMIERIKPQHGRRYFEQVLIEEKDNLSLISYNDFTEPAFLAGSMNSLLIDASSEHEYTIASKGLVGKPSEKGPVDSTIHWLLGKLFEVDPMIIAAYTFFDACTQKDEHSIPFNNFIINYIETEKLLSTKRDVPCFHGVNIFTHERWQNRDPIKWECFDWLQTIEDAALLGARKTGSENLLDVRPNLEWLHEKFIESELKNIMGKK